jgi:acyl-coenzyme A thioesterase PaaI-like protein
MTSLRTDYVSKILCGEGQPSPVSQLLGIAHLSVAPESDVLECSYEGVPAMLNPAGGIQGGMLSAMLDDVTATLVSSTLAPQEQVTTLKAMLNKP